MVKNNCGPVVRDEPSPPVMGIAEWVMEKLQFSPDPVQRRLLETRSPRVLVNCTRQWGKSTVTAINADVRDAGGNGKGSVTAARTVYEAATNPRSLTVVISPSARQSGEFLRKAEDFVRQLGVRPKGDGDNEMSLVFPKGGRIVGLPGNDATVRGFSAVTMMLVDEAAFVDDDLYLAIRPMLAVSGGTLWMMSTPHGKRGFFYNVWANGGEEWERVRVPATEWPRIAAKFLAQEKREMGARQFAQEYMCEFAEGTSGVFDMDLVRKAITPNVKPLVFR
jgi:phage FluMu gp28-like protein